MSGGGGKGGSQTSAQSIPAWVEGPARENLAQARVAGQIGYMPYYGPEVAGLSPMQQQSMQNTYSGLQAFGLAPEGQYQSNLPPLETYAGGVQGYGSGNLFDQAVAELALRHPEIAAQYEKFYNQPDAPVPQVSSGGIFRNPFMGGNGAFGPGSSIGFGGGFGPDGGGSASGNSGSGPAGSIGADGSPGSGTVGANGTGGW